MGRRVDTNYEAAEFFAKLQGWDKKSCFEEKAAVGRILIDVQGYTHREFGTNLPQAAGVEFFEKTSDFFSSAAFGGRSSECLKLIQGRGR